MLTIRILRSDQTLVFAAEELKKYLRMMMPEKGDILILWEDGKDGFRLGLLEDFGLPFHGEEAFLDDELYIDTDETGGILAGSNPRSVLFSVYRFLKLNGCRFLYPGIDGEYIPEKDIAPQHYEKLADHRFRGHCNEGAESQDCMIETIDFFPKQELNVYMLEFDIPFDYYDKYYSHFANEKNRAPERVSERQVLQWKRQCECEIQKRGLMFHDMGHGWTAEPFGISSTEAWNETSSASLPDEKRAYLAQINGKRDFWKGSALCTNLCMSRPDVKTIWSDAVVEYAANHQNVTHLHVWLADFSRNHCECEECQKKTPSDFYIEIMNEIDEKLTARGIDTRIVFIVYTDTLFVPREARLKNPKRFSMLYAPITRYYTSSITEQSIIPEPTPYVRNAWKIPRTSEECYSLLREWQKEFPIPTLTYEYHFWHHQMWDPGVMSFARRIYEDVQALKLMDIQGFVEDGSQRSFFPNSFLMYLYAESLMNRDLTLEEITEDYFSHAYGEDWREVVALLTKISTLCDHEYMTGLKSLDPEIGRFYNPEKAKDFEALPALAAEVRALAASHKESPNRPQTVTWKLFDLYAEYLDLIAPAYREKCLGNDALAIEKGQYFCEHFGRHEIAIERYYDHGLFGFYVLDRCKEKPKKKNQNRFVDVR